MQLFNKFMQRLRGKLLAQRFVRRDLGNRKIINESLNIQTRPSNKNRKMPPTTHLGDDCIGILFEVCSSEYLTRFNQIEPPVWNARPIFGSWLRRAYIHMFIDSTRV